MKRSAAKKSVQSLVDGIAEDFNADVWLTIISEKGTVNSIIVNDIEGGSITAAKKAIRTWAKKHKIKLQWLKPDTFTRVNPKKRKTKAKKKPKSIKCSLCKGTGKSRITYTKRGTPKVCDFCAGKGTVPSKKNPKRRAKKIAQIPPPFKKLTKKKINKLKGLFRVHPAAVMNPDPGDCPNCGMSYQELKTGLDFGAVKDMLWIQDSDPAFWRHKGRGSVLGLWYEIKRGMWADHLEMCGGRPISEAEYLDHLDELGGY